MDPLPLGYYRMKHKVERMIEEAGWSESGSGWTNLRTIQFHDLVLRLPAGAAPFPVMPLPSGVSLQPIDTGEVAGRPAELAVGEPTGRVADMGGPEMRPLPDPARACLRARGRHRPVLPVRPAGKAYAGTAEVSS